MAGRTYGQFCGLARALDLIGERWALLVVRDLFHGPKRYTDLRKGLRRIPTNILSNRLKELEQGGVVRRRLLPLPARVVVYELTDYGKDLEDIVVRLGLWGSRALGEPRHGDMVTVDSVIMSLRATFQVERARQLRVGYEIHVNDVVVHACVDDGVLRAAEGRLDGADLVITMDTAAQKALMTGDVSPEDAIAGGGVRVVGDRGLLARFVELFHIPPAPAAPVPGE